MITLKPGVVINPGPLDPLMEVLKDVSKIHGEIVVTSGNDGIHAIKSKHYKNEAVDIRSKGRTFERLEDVLIAIYTIAISRWIDLHIRIELDKDKLKHYWWTPDQPLVTPERKDFWDSRHIHLQIGR